MKQVDYNPYMQKEDFVPIMEQIITFLEEYDIAFDNQSVWCEKEWTDFRVEIKELTQMERINTWLKDDLVSVIKGHGDIEISAPNPLEGKEDELRIRIYALDTNV